MTSDCGGMVDFNSLQERKDVRELVDEDFLVAERNVCLHYE